jgi:hypothetical protein
MKMKMALRQAQGARMERGNGKGMKDEFPGIKKPALLRAGSNQT